MNRFNFVFLLGLDQWAMVAYDEFLHRDDVHLHPMRWPQNKLLALLCRAHNNPKINSVVRLPFHSVWFESYYNADFANPARPLCFVIDARRLQYGYMHEFLDYIRERYPSCRVVVYYFDLIRTYLPLAHPDCVGKKCDMLLSYDSVDAAKYGIAYHPTSFSDYNPGTPLGDDCDVYFLGLAKNRLSAIYDCYDRLTDNGLRCQFYVIGVSEADIRAVPGIYYIDSMSYVDNLRHVLSSRAILEIQQKGATGPTLRTWEAINYGRMLLTDNVGLRNTCWYSPDYVSFVDEAGVDCDAVKQYVVHENSLRDHIRPSLLIDFIANSLN